MLVVRVVALLFVSVVAACGPGDNCKNNSDCNYGGSQCLYCGSGGYCVASPSPPSPAPSPAPSPPPPSPPSPGDRVKYEDFLLTNVGKDTGMPLSYALSPSDYFQQVPADQRGSYFTEPLYVGQCGGEVSAANMNAYSFQTENYLTATGLNLYDGAVWSIAACVTGHCDEARTYQNKVLVAGKTFQLANIRGDAPCKGVIEWGECTDPDESGACGLCYGDGPTPTLPHDQTFFFRFVGDYYALEGTIDARCPDKKLWWVWNDWKPILGENAWAQLTGPVQSLYLAAGGNPNAVDDNDPLLLLAINFLKAVEQMIIPGMGGAYYAPRNMFVFGHTSPGSSASVENNASLLAGLKALLALLQGKTSTSHAAVIPDIQNLIVGVSGFLKQAYDPTLGFFWQGGSRNHTTGGWTWGSQEDSVPDFAVDCQTWVASALGPELVDEWFGAGTTLKLWQTVKKLGGYAPQANGYVKGVGFTDNGADQVFSGEWTMGAINFLNIIANSSVVDATTRSDLLAEIAFMRQAVDAELRKDISINNSQVPTLLYSNKRYRIPFGWWANPLPAAASSAWAVLVDLSFNPLELGGSYTVKKVVM